jgi:protein ImuB
MHKFAVRSSTVAPEFEEKTETKFAFRPFRPALPAKVKLREGRPVFATFQGRSGDVVHASGPWRTSGDWWEDSPWQHDAWDLELRFAHETPPMQGLYRICFDCLQKKWFVRGAYD